MGMQLFRIPGVWMRDADPVIGEGGMQVGRRDFGHVAAGAILVGHGAGAAGMILGFFFRRACGVAGETICVVRGDLVRERLMRIMAGCACDAGIAFGPAAAVFKAIGCEADVEDTGFDHLAGDDVLPGAVARATEVDGIDAGQLSRIED